LPLIHSPVGVYCAYRWLAQAPLCYTLVGSNMAHEPDWVRKSSLPQYVICVSPWFLSDYASLAWLQGLICPLHVEKGIVPPVLATSHTARVREVLQPAVRDGRQLQDCMAMLMRACSSLQSWPNT